MACRRYNHPITIQKESTPVADGHGGYAAAWETYAGGWAAIESPKGGESLFAGQLQASITHVLYMPYLAGVTAKMRVLFGARVFNIRAPLDEGERHLELKLLCEEGVAT